MTSKDIIAQVKATNWNVRDELKDKTLNQLIEISKNDTRPFGVCAINITGDLNLGMLIRTSCLLGAERFIIYGKQSYDRRSTVGAHNYIDIVKAGSTDRSGSMEIDYSEFFPIMEKYDYQPVFIETGGKSLYEFDPKYSIAHNRIPCLIFGNEGIGIEPSLMVNQQVFSIPQRGVLRSLNVSSAASIAINYVSNYFANKYRDLK